MGHGATTVTRAGVGVRRTLSVGTGGDLRVELEIDSEHEYPVAVRIREPLPDELDPSDIEVDDAGGDGWWVFGGEFELSRIVKPGETTRTAYVARTLAGNGGIRPDAPTIEAVLPVDPEDAESGDVPLWRGQGVRVANSSPENGKDPSDIRSNGSRPMTRSNTTAVPMSPSEPIPSTLSTNEGNEGNGEKGASWPQWPNASSTDAESRSFAIPSVDISAVGSRLRRRLEASVGLGAFRRSERTRGAPLSDDAFDVLSNARRRRVLIHLFEADEPATLAGLSRSVAAWENGVGEDVITSRQRKRVYTALRQSHLPKMDRAGVIDYDADRGSVELTDEAAGLRTYLDLTVRQWNWERYVLLVGVFWCGVIGATWAGVGSSGPLTGSALAGLAGLSVVCSALVWIYAGRIGAT